MVNVLIISQDATTINSLTGIGKFYSFLINCLQKFRLFIILKLTSSQKKILIVSDRKQTPLTNHSIIYWDQILSKTKLKKNRDLAWQITNKIINPLFKKLRYQNIPFIKLWKTYLTAHLSFNILGYHQALKKIINNYHPSQIIICGSSSQEQLAKLIAKQNNIKVISYNLFDFSFFNRLLIDWLYNRQIKLKLNKFLISKTMKFNQPSSGSYLLIASFFRHLKTLVPLSQGLNHQSFKNVFVADDLSIQKSLAKLHTSFNNCQFLRNYLNSATINQILKQQEQVGRSAWKEFTRKLSLPSNTIENLSINLFQGYLKTLFLRAFPLTCLYIEAGNNLIKKVRPRAIFLVSDLRPLETSLGLLAKKNKIPSFLVSPNTILSLDAINQYSIADKITVVGSYIKKQLIEIGVPTQKIHLVGDLRFDTITNAKIKKHQQKIYQQFELNPQLKLFLLISFRANSRIPLSEKRRFFEIAHQAINQIPQGQLIIKPHPTETKKKVLNQLKQWRITNVLVTDNEELELIELLSTCHAVLLTWSMTGFESMTMKKPVIVINSTRKNYDEIIPYVKTGGAQLAKSTPQLKKILKQLINNPKYYNQWVKNGQQFVKQYIKTPDHQVVQRISRLIKTPLIGRK